MAESLYDRLGGLSAVAHLIFAFYEGVQRSPRLAPYFRNVQMRRLVEHQTKFVSQLMGGPPAYSDAELRRVHASLGIDVAAFEEMLALFAEALRDCGLAEGDAAGLIAEMRARRGAVIASPPGAPAEEAAPEPVGS